MMSLPLPSSDRVRGYSSPSMPAVGFVGTPDSASPCFRGPWSRGTLSLSPRRGTLSGSPLEASRVPSQPSASAEDSGRVLGNAGIFNVWLRFFCFCVQNELIIEILELRIEVNNVMLFVR